MVRLSAQGAGESGQRLDRLTPGQLFLTDQEIVEGRLGRAAGGQRLLGVGVGVGPGLLEKMSPPQVKRPRLHPESPRPLQRHQSTASGHISRFAGGGLGFRLGRHQQQFETTAGHVTCLGVGEELGTIPAALLGQSDEGQRRTPRLGPRPR